MNATLENPLVAERDEDGRGTYEIFADKTRKPKPAHLRFLAKAVK